MLSQVVKKFEESYGAWVSLEVPHWVCKRDDDLYLQPIGELFHNSAVAGESEDRQDSEWKLHTHKYIQHVIKTSEVINSLKGSNKYSW